MHVPVFAEGALTAKGNIAVGGGLIAGEPLDLAAQTTRLDGKHFHAIDDEGSAAGHQAREPVRDQPAAAQAGFHHFPGVGFRRHRPIHEQPEEGFDGLDLIQQRIDIRPGERGRRVGQLAQMACLFEQSGVKLLRSHSEIDHRLAEFAQPMPHATPAARSTLPHAAPCRAQHPAVRSTLPCATPAVCNTPPDPHSLRSAVSSSRRSCSPGSSPRRCTGPRAMARRRLALRSATCHRRSYRSGLRQPANRCN